MFDRKRWLAELRELQADEDLVTVEMTKWQALKLLLVLQRVYRDPAFLGEDIEKAGALGGDLQLVLSLDRPAVGEWLQRGWREEIDPPPATWPAAGNGR